MKFLPTKVEFNVVLHCIFSIILWYNNFKSSQVKQKTKYWT